MKEKGYLEMRTVTRKLLICLVFGFFICGLHCKSVPYPNPAICEYHGDCLKGKAKCVRRECHCKEYYDHGDGKTECERWRKCTKDDCPQHSHCLMHPENSDVTCKCDDGYFGHAQKSGCLSADTLKGAYKPYPCLFDANCPKFSECSEEACTCLEDYYGDGEFCEQGRPVACFAVNRLKECNDDLAKCIDGLCRCVGMSIGDGKYCRKALRCKDNFKCGKNRHCLLDPYLLNQPRCVCNDDAKVTPYGECVDCFGDADCKDNSQICSKQECECIDGLVMGDHKLCKPGPLHRCSHHRDCDSRAKCIKGLCFCVGSSTGNGKFCRDSRPCPADPPCGKNSKCVIDPLIPDLPHCVCSEGFRKTDNRGCVEMLDCFGENGQNCTGGQICREFEDGSRCSCRDGYEMVSTGGKSTCQDVNECSKLDSCQPNSVCQNLEGSYECKCKDGYKKNNGLCQDEDECFENEGMCKAGARCVNFEGGFSCLCKKGYFKKDDECLKDECEVDCEENEECYGGECRCRKSYRKNIEGYCVAVSLKAGSAQISAYLSTFIFGALGGLALSA